VDQLVVAQGLQPCRHPHALQVCRAGAVDHAQAAQGPGDQRKVTERTNAQHAVEALAHQVDLAIGATDLQRQPRVLLHERRQGRQNDAPCHQRRQVDAQATVQLGRVGPKQPFELVHSRQQVFATLVQLQAILGGLYTPRGAVEQARAQVPLKQAHLFRDGRTRQPQALTGQGEARQFGNPHKGAQQLQRVHPAPSLFDPTEQYFRIQRIYQYRSDQ